MSIQLFDETTFACSMAITRKYSTSFSLGIRMLGKRYQNPIYGIYGYVRLADEIVDTFHHQDKKTLLDEFERETWNAIERRISLNPAIHAFQKTIHDYTIDLDLVKAFLQSMRMDLENKQYSAELYQQYIYGSAEVVGLMCLKVFCDGNAEMYNALKAPARSLGAAFQKVNFLRDVKDDFDGKGRIYFPGVNFHLFTESAKREIEADIQKDFDDALEGIRRLPEGSRIGVYIAYKYYLKLFKKIKSTQPSRILQERIRISNTRKMAILARSVARYKLNLL